MFGRGCLNNLYKEFNVSKPGRMVKNKELYFCTKIAWRNHRFFLNKDKKIEITRKYIALKYIEKMDYSFLEIIEKNLKMDIKNISMFSSKETNDLVSFKLNDIYKILNYSQNFKEKIKQFENVNWNKIDEKTAKQFLKSVSFIFDVTKITSPISYIVFYSMQYMFWQTVVVGGLLSDMTLSSILLEHSLVPFGKQIPDLLIDDEKVTKEIKNSNEYNNKIREIVEKYCKKGNSFMGNSSNNADCKIEFNDKDLFLAIHGASISIKIEKNNIENGSSWNVNMNISDTYDFTDFKGLKKYLTSNSSKIMSVFSTTLNNFAVVSTEYGVIRPYKILIKITEDNHIIQ